VELALKEAMDQVYDRLRNEFNYHYKFPQNERQS
jgi:hypothetical protein